MTQDRMKHPWLGRPPVLGDMDRESLAQQVYLLAILLGRFVWQIHAILREGCDHLMGDEHSSPYADTISKRRRSSFKREWGTRLSCCSRPTMMLGSTSMSRAKASTASAERTPTEAVNRL